MLLLPVLMLVGAATCTPLPGSCEMPVRADSVVDSIGVDIHLHSGDSVYGNFDLIQGLLVDLGVRHVRDGLIDTTWQPYYKEFVSLAKHGIRGIFITEPSQSDSLLSTWPARVPGAFEGYEAPNEFDNSGDANWARTLNAFVPRLYRVAKANSSTSQLPVIGPSLIQATDYAAIADLTPFFDYANMHNYFAGRNPGTAGWGLNGYGSISYNLALANGVSAKHPVITTETGYSTAPDGRDAIPEEVEGVYLPRVFLEQALHGVTRTYIYELIDESQAKEPVERYTGLARADGSPKPAFRAVKNLIRTLSDPGATFLPTPLSFSLSGGSANVHHLLMAKRDGTYDLAVWLETQDFDVTQRKATPAVPERVTFHTDRSFSTARVFRFAPDGAIGQETVAAGRSIALTVSNRVSILQLK